MTRNQITQRIVEAQEESARYHALSAIFNDNDWRMVAARYQHESRKWSARATGMLIMLVTGRDSDGVPFVIE